MLAMRHMRIQAFSCYWKWNYNNLYKMYESTAIAEKLISRPVRGSKWRGRGVGIVPSPRKSRHREIATNSLPPALILLSPSPYFSTVLMTFPCMSFFLGSMHAWGHDRHPDRANALSIVPQRRTGRCMARRGFGCSKRNVVLLLKASSCSVCQRF